MNHYRQPISSLLRPKLALGWETMVHWENESDGEQRSNLLRALFRTTQLLWARHYCLFSTIPQFAPIFDSHC